jgi:hypothetical protein
MSKIVLQFVFILSILFSQKVSLPDSLISDDPIKNPNYSLTLSMLYPGLGQVHNETYLRAGLYFTTFSYFVYNALAKHQSISDIKSGKMNHVFPTAESRSEATDRAFDRRNVWIWRAFGLYLLNLMDAYSGAYLYRFDDIMDSDKTAELSFKQRDLTSLELNFTISF